MKLATALAIMTTLTQGAVAYVVEAYAERDCQGEFKRINVWRNSCRNNIPTARSVKLVGYGAWHQRAAIYAEKWCAIGLEDQTWWTDGGSVQVGDCKTFDFEAESVASWFVAG